MRLRDEGLALRQVGGKTVILDLASSTYFAAGGVGTVILDLLQQHERSEDELVDHLRSRFSVETEVLRADVRAFLDRLQVAGLLAP